MAAEILDGKTLSSQIYADITRQTVELKKKGITPGLAAILVGDDPASHTYVKMKREAAENCGFYGVVKQLPSTATTGEVIAAVQQFNSDNKIHGILVQLPLPSGIDRNKVLESILPSKDADGLTVQSLGAIASKDQGFIPATARGVMELLKTTGVQLSGKKACVVGEGVQTGRPIAPLLLNELCTVTICNKETTNISQHMLEADILVSCVGKANLISGEMVKQGAIAIGVGVSKLGGKTVGDFDFEGAKQKASWITPMPGGTGPMTVAMLMKNTLESAQKQLD